MTMLLFVDLVLYIQSAIFQSCWDRSSRGGPVLSRGKSTLLKDTMERLRLGSNPQPLDLESNTPPVSH